MIVLLWLVAVILSSPFQPKWRLEAENATLQHQLMVLRRQVPRRIRLTNVDRVIRAQLCRCFPSILKVLAVVQPKTVVRWHRPAFALLPLEMRAGIPRPRLQLAKGPKLNVHLFRICHTSHCLWSFLDDEPHARREAGRRSWSNCYDGFDAGRVGPAVDQLFSEPHRARNCDRFGGAGVDGPRCFGCIAGPGEVVPLARVARRIILNKEVRPFENHAPRKAPASQPK